jgi:hypothetical protein
MVAPDEDWDVFLAALAKSRADWYAGLNRSTAAASSSAALSAADYAAKFGVPAASVSIPDTVGTGRSVEAGSAADPSSWIKPEGIEASGAK